MKKVSRFALATMLSLGALGITAAPANAQRTPKGAKDDPAAALQLQLSPEFRKPAQAAQTAINAKDWATAETQVAAMESLAKNDAEKYWSATMRFTLEANKKSDEGELKALASLLANPATPAKELPHDNYLNGWVLFGAKRYAEAIPSLLKARAGGSTESQLPLMLVQSYYDTNNVTDGAAEMVKAIEAEKAAGRKPPEGWYSVTFSKIYGTSDRAATLAWATRWFTEYPTLANWRFVLVNYRNGNDKAAGALGKKEKIEVFRLMRASHALADEADYFDYAEASRQTGLPWESIAVLDEGKAAGKVPPGDAQFNSVYTSAQAAVKGESPLETQAKAAAAAATGKDAAGTGDAFLASGNFARAEALYEMAVQKGSVDPDQINLHRGYALYQLGRKAEARQAFALVTKAPLSDIAHFWTLWIDTPTPAA